jgi:hypothetical protein
MKYSFPIMWLVGRNRGGGNLSAQRKGRKQMVIFVVDRKAFIFPSIPSKDL